MSVTGVITIHDGEYLKENAKTKRHINSLVRELSGRPLTSRRDLLDILRKEVLILETDLQRQGLLSGVKDKKVDTDV